MSLLARNLSLVALLLLTGSEAMIVQWALMASGRPALGARDLAVLVALLALVNGGLVASLRRRSRRGRLGLVWGRVVMLTSLGALVTGPLLLVGFALPLWALQGMSVDAAQATGALVASGGAAVALGFGSILWGYTVGQRRVQIETVELPMRQLPEPLEGLRIAHITDLHIGSQLRAPQLARFVERVNALDPDLVAITGDIFDHDPAFIDEGCAELAKLRARHGVYAILGNHDVYTGAEAVSAGLARHGTVRLLRDECERLSIRGCDLYLIGIEDPGRGWHGRKLESAALERLADELPDDAASLLLMHRPSYFEQVVRLRLPVALAGHTHGGQVSLPRPAHQQNLSRLMTRWTRGRFDRGDSVLYVSRGLGIAGPPIRLNCPREISLLSLTSGP